MCAIAGTLIGNEIDDELLTSFVLPEQRLKVWFGVNLFEAGNGMGHWNESVLTGR